MSAIIEPTTATPKRGPGRPRKNPVPDSGTKQPTLGTFRTAITDLPVADWYDLPCMPDEEMEQYGGDLSALDSWSPKAKRPLASWRDAPPISKAMPDLSPKGLLVNRHAPEQKFHFAYLHEDGSPSFQQAILTMRLRGYKPALLSDWYVHSLLRDVLVPEDVTGRLTLGGALKGGATVVYVQDEANYRRIKAYERQQSDHIQKSAEQRQAELQDGINRDGLAGVHTSTDFSED